MGHGMTMFAGKAMMGYAGNAPWHAGETNPTCVSEEAQKDFEKFMVESGLNWPVEKHQLALEDLDIKMNLFAVKRLLPDGTWSLISDSKAVGSRYEILQNVDAFKWFDPFLKANEAKLHTAGALMEGSRIWVLAKLNRDPIEVVKNDLVEKYLLLSHAHDGSSSIRVGFTPIRVVCDNTLSAAIREDASKLLRVRHSKSMKSNLESIRDVMDLANQQFEATAEKYKLLASKQINQADVRKYVRQVFKVEENVKDEEINTRMKNVITLVESLIDSGKGNNMPGVRGTMWAAYNGVTEYLSWEWGKPKKGKDTKVDSRMNSLWFGENADMNKHALELALQMAS